MFSTNQSKSSAGVSILLVVFIMSIVLAIGLGISAIAFQQIKLLRDIGHSVIAFSAADSGIENHLYMLYKLDGATSSFSGNCGSAAYLVQTICGNRITTCPPGFTQDSGLDAYYLTKSIGTYQETKRAIEIVN